MKIGDVWDVTPLKFGISALDFFEDPLASIVRIAGGGSSIS